MGEQLLEGLQEQSSDGGPLPELQHRVLASETAQMQAAVRRRSSWGVAPVVTLTAAWA